MKLLNQAKNIPVVLSSSQIKFWIKWCSRVIVGYTNNQTEITTLYRLDNIYKYPFCIFGLCVCLCSISPPGMVPGRGQKMFTLIDS